MQQDQKKYRLIMLLLLAGMILALVGSLAWTRYTEKDYVSVKAELIRIEKKSGKGTKSRMDLYKVETYQFALDGQEYTASKNGLWLLPHKVGKTYDIRCNPAAPSQLADTAKTTTTLLVLPLLAVALALLLADMVRARH